MCRSPGETVSHLLALLLCTTDRKASYHYALALLFVVAIFFHCGDKYRLRKAKSLPFSNTASVLSTDSSIDPEYTLTMWQAPKESQLVEAGPEVDGLRPGGRW